MNNRERAKAILNYQPYDRMPLVAFGYWEETLLKWANEGYITLDEAEGYKKYGDNSQADRSIMAKLGFDFNWSATFGANYTLFPRFEPEVLSQDADGFKTVRDGNGLITRVNDRITSIPSMVGTSLTGREAWEELYLPRLKLAPERVNWEALKEIRDSDATREIPLAIHLGSMYGCVRDMLGVEALSYLYADDEDLYREVLGTIGNISHETAKLILEYYDGFDYAHYWEDICFKNGPLVNPAVFEECVVPNYARNAELAHAHGINIISLDCDGKIDLLIPCWLKGGVNTMFPIEVGVWEASIAPWREKYGRELRGVGGMDKRVFAGEKADVDREVERLRRLVDLGGFIPCPDHRIAPDAKFENVAYYCERFERVINVR